VTGTRVMMYTLRALSCTFFCNKSVFFYGKRNGEASEREVHLI
jgi:hypothetical protein